MSKRQRQKIRRQRHGSQPAAAPASFAELRAQAIAAGVFRVGMTKAELARVMA